jgi:glutathione S-transferase
MKLYTMPGACSLATHIVLEWIGQPYQARTLNHDEIKTPDFLAINPAGAVPVLDDDGWVLTQNAAILNYLIDRFPDAGLGGDGSARTRAEINRWLGLLNADLHPTFKPLFGATGYLEDDQAIERSKADARASARLLFQRLDAQLAGRDWLAGPRSPADAYLFVVTRWARAMRVDLSGMDHLHAWFARMRTDAGVERAMQAEGLS